MYKKISVPVILCMLSIQLRATDKLFIPEDCIYENNIKTVLLYPKMGSARDIAQSPVLPIQQSYPLILAFDELYENYKSYYIKIIHCNKDWSVSFLMSMEYMNEINESLITTYSISTSTKVPYVHYQVEIPKVKLTGNYIVKVYRNRDEDDIIISRRFMVYDNKVQINPQITFSNVASEMKKNQQINFTISYSGVDIINPQQNVQVVIRQNQRWDNAIYNLPPLFVKENDKLLEYTYFNLENNFKGGNEFRSFDTRTATFAGMNVEKINMKPNGPAEAYLFVDKPRDKQPYSWMPDINGKYVVENYDLDGSATTGADYIKVYFSLFIPKLSRGNVYVAGGFSDWKINELYQLDFDPIRNVYTGAVLVKQGWYNYTYLIEESTRTGIMRSSSAIDGDYVDTENQYEVLVYTRPVGSRSDVLIGYISIQYNMRN